MLNVPKNSLPRTIESKLMYPMKYAILGVDEVGRGPLCGPVVAVATWLHPSTFNVENINDSKAVIEEERLKIFKSIMDHVDTSTICNSVETPQNIKTTVSSNTTFENTDTTCENIQNEKNRPPIIYGVGIVCNHCIDSINILSATQRAMSIASMKCLINIAHFDGKINVNNLSMEFKSNCPNYSAIFNEIIEARLLDEENIENSNIVTSPSKNNSKPPSMEIPNNNTSLNTLCISMFKEVSIEVIHQLVRESHCSNEIEVFLRQQISKIFNSKESVEILIDGPHIPKQMINFNQYIYEDGYVERISEKKKKKKSPKKRKKTIDDFMIPPVDNQNIVENQSSPEYLYLTAHPVIKGDGKELNIATSSVIAKVIRDEIIEKALFKNTSEIKSESEIKAESRISHSLSNIYREDHLLQVPSNKGYGTMAHRSALSNRQWIPNEEYRVTFAPLKEKLVADSFQKYGVKFPNVNYDKIIKKRR